MDTARIMSEALARGSARACQANRFLRARGNAQPTRMALLAAHHERLFASVSPRFQPTHERQLRELGVAELAHLEDAVGTNSDAILFALAAIAIDHR
jgi:hypothetical protein